MEAPYSAPSHHLTESQCKELVFSGRCQQGGRATLFLPDLYDNEVERVLLCAQYYFDSCSQEIEHEKGEGDFKKLITLSNIFNHLFTLEKIKEKSKLFGFITSIRYTLGMGGAADKKMGRIVDKRFGLLVEKMKKEGFKFKVRIKNYLIVNESNNASIFNTMEKIVCNNKKEFTKRFGMDPRQKLLELKSDILTEEELRSWITLRELAKFCIEVSVAPQVKAMLREMLNDAEKEINDIADANIAEKNKFLNFYGENQDIFIKFLKDKGIGLLEGPYGMQAIPNLGLEVQAAMRRHVFRALREVVPEGEEERGWESRLGALETFTEVLCGLSPEAEDIRAIDGLRIEWLRCLLNMSDLPKDASELSKRQSRQIEKLIFEVRKKVLPNSYVEEAEGAPLSTPTITGGNVATCQTYEGRYNIDYSHASPRFAAGSFSYVLDGSGHDVRWIQLAQTPLMEKFNADLERALSLQAPFRTIEEAQKFYAEHLDRLSVEMYKVLDVYREMGGYSSQPAFSFAVLCKIGETDYLLHSQLSDSTIIVRHRDAAGNMHHEFINSKYPHEGLGSGMGMTGDVPGGKMPALEPRQVFPEDVILQTTDGVGEFMWPALFEDVVNKTYEADPNASAADLLKALTDTIIDLGERIHAGSVEYKGPTQRWGKPGFTVELVLDDNGLPIPAEHKEMELSPDAVVVEISNFKALNGRYLVVHHPLGKYDEASITQAPVAI